MVRPTGFEPVAYGLEGLRLCCKEMRYSLTMPLVSCT